MKIINWVAAILVIVGALNWGFIGLLNWNLVTTFFGEMTTLTNVIYDLIGLAAIYALFWMLPKMTK